MNNDRYDVESIINTPSPDTIHSPTHTLSLVELSSRAKLVRIIYEKLYKHILPNISAPYILFYSTRCLGSIKMLFCMIL